MMTQPDSPFLGIGIAMLSGVIAYLCHRLIKAMEANTLLPISDELKRDKGRSFPMRGTWPFRDKYQAQFASRSYLHALMILTKWGLIVMTLLLGVMYPLVYLIKFVGR